jgi:hypothetical protein
MLYMYIYIYNFIYIYIYNADRSTSLLKSLRVQVKVIEVDVMSLHAMSLISNGQSGDEKVGSWLGSAVGMVVGSWLGTAVGIAIEIVGVEVVVVEVGPGVTNLGNSDTTEKLRSYA